MGVSPRNAISHPSKTIQTRPKLTWAPWVPIKAKKPETLYRPRLRRADIAQQFHKNSQLLPNNQLRGRSVKSRRSDPNRSSTSPRRLQRSSRRRHMNGKTSVAIRGEIASYVERCWLRHQKPKVKNTAAARPNQVMAY